MRVAGRVSKRDGGPLRWEFREVTTIRYLSCHNAVKAVRHDRKEAADAGLLMRALRLVRMLERLQLRL
jgi:hypothetical protein